MVNITSGTMLTAAFENSSLLSDLPTAKLFYYEPPNISGTVNFGYGINLSLAAQDPTAKLIVGSTDRSGYSARQAAGHQEQNRRREWVQPPCRP
jgi:hypothetical protein